MPPRSLAPLPEVDPVYVREIPPDSYGSRQIRHVVRDVVDGRGKLVGVTAALRDALAKANGKTVVLTITTK